MHKKALTEQTGSDDEPGAMDLTTCYMCQSEATSKEHAPPRAFFPQKKDLPDTDLRQNLITVPSCDLHNTSQSKDDEYALLLLSTFCLNNEIGDAHFKTKVRRAIERNPNLVRLAYGQNQRVTVDKKPTLAFKVDDRRFEATMEKTAKATWFHHFKVKWLVAVHVHGLSFVQKDMRVLPEVKRMRSIVEAAMRDKPVHGENQEVYAYRVYKEDDLRVIQMTFYGGFDVVVFSEPRIS